MTWEVLWEVSGSQQATITGMAAFPCEVESLP